MTTHRRSGSAGVQPRLARATFGVIMAVVVTVTGVAQSHHGGGERVPRWPRSGHGASDSGSSGASGLAAFTSPPAAAPPASTPPATSPPTTGAPRVPSPAEATGLDGLRLVAYPWPRLGYRLDFEPGRPDLLGKTDCGAHVVTVYVRPSQTRRQVAFVTAFELAHAVDCQTMTNDRRTRWAALRGFPAGWAWFPGCVCPEDDYGSGDFAMVFATWLVSGGGYSWRSTLAPPPSPSELERLRPYLQPWG